MRRLSSVDAQFLAMEDGRTHAHVCQLTIVDRVAADGTVIDAARMHELIADRIDLLPPLRWIIKEVPFELDYPVLVEDPDFDLDSHIGEEAVPEPGDDHRLGELVARIASRPLDRSKPLWELTVIHGVHGDRTAILVKLHHAVVDGVAGIQLLSTLLDTEPDGRPDQPPPVESAGRTPNDAELFVRGLAALPMQPVKAMQALPATLRNLDQIPTLRNLPGADLLHASAEQAHRMATRNKDGRVLEQPAPQAPKVSFSGAISAHRRFAFGTLPLATIKAIKKSGTGWTVNDVIVATVAGALRRRLMARGDVTTEPLVALVPISVKGRDGDDNPYGNHLSSLIVPIPTDEADPAERLGRAHDVMASAKKRHRATPASLMADANSTVPPALFARTARLISSTTAAGWVNPPFNVTISNIPGSRRPLYCAGARVVSQHPVNVLLDGVSLSITLLSYEANVDIGLTADRELFPDVWDLMDDLHAELDTLAALEPTTSKP